MKNTIHRFIGRFTAALVVLADPASLWAQNRAVVEAGVGSRVRITTHGSPKPIVGVVASMDEADVALLGERGNYVRVRRSDIQSAQLSVDRRRRTMRGVAIGAAAGAAFGALIASAASDSDSYSYSYGYYGEPLSVGESAATFASGGAVWGAIFGYRSQVDEWIPAAFGTGQRAATADVSGPPAPESSENGPAAASEGRGAQGFAPRNGLFPGAQVRVVHGGESVVGALVGLDDSEVVVSEAGGMRRVPRSSVQSISIRTGEKGNTLRGLVIGGVLGAALDFASEPYCVTGSDGLPRDCSRAESATETALGGAVIGGVIGYLTKRPTWTVSSLDAPRHAGGGGASLTVAPTFRRGGGGLRLRLTW